MNLNSKLNAVIIVAGGEGKRMQTKIPKQFLILRDLPVLMHTLIKFYNFNSKIKIILVLPQNHISFWQQLCKKHSFNINHKIVKGGKERFNSVKNGLKYLSSEKGIVAIHDGVRPLVNFETINQGIKTTLKHKAAIPVVAITSSVRFVENNQNRQLNRKSIKIVQTPQFFDIKLIKKAYNTDFKSFYTDDASVVEHTKKCKIALFDGNTENIKITNKIDLELAKLYLENYENNQNK